MGYRGGAPPWVYKREMATRQMSHDSHVRSLEEKIRELEKAKSELMRRIEDLEKENTDIKNKLKKEV